MTPHKPPSLPKHARYGTHDPDLNYHIPHRTSWKMSNGAAVPTHFDAVTALVADMRCRAPQLCGSIQPGFDIHQIFVDDMLNGCAHNFLRLVATQIAMENLAGANHTVVSQLTEARHHSERQKNAISDQAVEINNQAAELATRRGNDNTHLAGEIFGYGHAETALPTLRYNPHLPSMDPITPVVTTAKTYEHDTGNGKVVVSMPPSDGSASSLTSSPSPTAKPFEHRSFNGMVFSDITPGLKRRLGVLGRDYYDDEVAAESGILPERNYGEKVAAGALLMMKGGHGTCNSEVVVAPPPGLQERTVILGREHYDKGIKAEESWEGGKDQVTKILKTRRF